MRYLINFTKESEIKFISYLDMLRTIERIIGRSKLPIEFSQGFNPHMSISIAQPLPVGVYSSSEYMDLNFEKDIAEWYVKDTLNDAAPKGIKFKGVYKVENVPLSMAAIDAASYEINIRYKKTDDINSEMEKLLKNEEWMTLKKSKSKERIVDIKSMIKEFNYTIKDNTLIVKSTISCGSRENLSPQLLCKYIQDSTSNADFEAFTDIKRTEMLRNVKGELLPLYKALK